MATGVVTATTIRYCDALGVEQGAQWGEVAPGDLAASLPVRVPPTFAEQRNYPGLFWSVRSGRHLVYESLLELSHLWLMDLDAAAGRIATQPFQVVVNEAGRMMRHVPDILRTRIADRTEVIDVKPLARTSARRFREQVEVMAELCTAIGWDYRVATEPDPVVIRNARYLAAGRRAPALVPEWAMIVEGAAALVGMSIERAVSRLSEECPANLGFPCVAGLIWWGHLGVALTVPIGAHTVLEES